MYNSAVWLADNAPVSSHLLPIVIVVSVVGVVLLAWFLLQGYGDKD